MTQRLAFSDLFLKILATLNEAQARWYVAREAIRLGRGGLKAMHELTGMSRPTILKGIRELRGHKSLGEEGRVRRPGGGRRPLQSSDPNLVPLLERILHESTAGDPLSLLKWTNKSVARIAEELTRRGHPTSDETVRRWLKQMNYSLEAKVKGKEGAPPAVREEQFQYINRQVRQFLARKDPVIAIEIKKTELVRECANPGRAWRGKGQARVVNVYDFEALEEDTVLPRDASGPQRNRGLVNVSMTHDMAELAVESLRRWWRLLGRYHYPQARGLLLCADNGGSDGSHSRAWRFFLQSLADELGIPITVCHYPLATSKWHKVEHRMFSFTSLSWRGEPLTTYETVLKLIGATSLRVKSRLHRRVGAAEVEISDPDRAALRLHAHDVHPQWNYTIAPREPHQGKIYIVGSREGSGASVTAPEFRRD